MVLQVNYTVGITSVQVTPAGSAKSYACVISQSTMKIENTNDSVDWDVADAALTTTKIEAAGTLGTNVYYNDTEINSGGRSRCFISCYLGG